MAGWALRERVSSSIGPLEADARRDRAPGPRRPGRTRARQAGDGLGQVLAHAHGLGALPGKKNGVQDRASHALLPPLHQHGAPGEAAAEGHDQDQVALLEPPAPCGLVEGQDHRGGRGVAVPLQVDEQLVAAAPPGAGPIAWMMRMLAWCGITQATSSIVQPGRAPAPPGRHRVMVDTACLKTSRPCHLHVVESRRDRLSAVAGLRLPPPGSMSSSARAPSEPMTDARMPCPGSPPAAAPPRRRRRRTARRSSRSFQSTMQLIFSAPMTSTVSTLPASTNWRPDLQGVEEPRTGRLEVEAEGVAGADLVLHEAGRAGERHVGRDRGHEDQVDVGRPPSRRPRAPAGRRRRPCPRSFRPPRRCAAPACRCGVRIHSSVVSTMLLEIGVGQHPLRGVGSGPGHGRHEAARWRMASGQAWASAGRSCRITSMIWGLRWWSTLSAATRMALRTAQALEEPWPMMQTPLTPSSGAPP